MGGRIIVLTVVFVLSVEIIQDISIHAEVFDKPVEKETLVLKKISNKRRKTNRNCRKNGWRYLFMNGNDELTQTSKVIIRKYYEEFF